MSFDQFKLDPRIMRGIQDAGYQTPTPIQAQAIPEVLSGNDVLGLAQTGTGKTAAFMLPVLQRLTRGKLRKIRVLVVAPTRELAEQIHVSAENLATHDYMLVYFSASHYCCFTNLTRTTITDVA